MSHARILWGSCRLGVAPPIDPLSFGTVPHLLMSLTGTGRYNETIHGEGFELRSLEMAWYSSSGGTAGSTPVPVHNNPFPLPWPTHSPSWLSHNVIMVVKPVLAMDPIPWICC